jgi:hypothetical protein
MACVERARNGHLLDGLPASAAGFTITKVDGAVHLHRDGRALTDAEGAALWKGFSSEVFMQGGLSMGSSGMYSIYRCDDAAPPSCIKVDMWMCQVSIETLATRVQALLDTQGLADAELTIDARLEEAAGPRCKGDSCRPQPHYSTKDMGTFDAWRPRHSLDDGRGTCTGDGDCNGSQTCTAWYLAGGAETAEFRQLPEPTWCGCVEARCTWFTQ